MTYDEAAAKKILSDDEEKKLWDRFYECVSDSAFVDDGKSDQLRAIIREAPCVVENEDEIRGLWPCSEEMFLWVAMHKDHECCMSDEEAAQFEALQQL